eukprot:10647959-Alexandrium_andersonii.AAC.1
MSPLLLVHSARPLPRIQDAISPSRRDCPSPALQPSGSRIEAASTAAHAPTMPARVGLSRDCWG